MSDNLTAKRLGGCLLHSFGRAVGMDRCLPALLAGRLDVVYVREQAPLTFYLLPLSASDVEATLFVFLVLLQTAQEKASCRHAS